MTKIELRNIDLTSEKDLVINGLIPTESLSEVLKSGNKRFREKIARGAFSKSLSNKKDIDLLAEHDTKKILASSRNGSLHLEESKRGLFLSSKLVGTSLGKDYHELIKSGILRNLSFGFRVVKDRWETINGEMIRTITELDLTEVSIVRNPAYVGTELSARGIDVIENIQIPETKKITQEKDVENNMAVETVVVEKRNVNTLTEELRALTTSAEATAVVPVNVAGEVIKKMGEISPIFEKARKFETVNGNLKIPVENDTVVASFVGEGLELQESDLVFDYVELKQKRVGAVVSLSQQLINDSSIDLDGYVSDLLARRTVAAVEKSMLLGTGDVNNEFKGIFNEEGITEVETAVAQSVTMDDLNALYTSLNPAFIDSAAFYMSRALFNQVAKLKDNNGHYFLSSGVINGRITYMLLGAPVYVSEAITSTEYPILFGNVEQAVGVLVKKNPTLTRVANDSKNALRGAVMFVFDLYADSAVVNKQSIAKLHVKQA